MGSPGVKADMSARPVNRSADRGISGGEAQPAPRSVTPPRVLAHPASQLSTAILFLLIVIALHAGWQTRDEWHLSGESDIRYVFGIAGGTMMVLLLSYSIRKRAAWMRRWGPIRYWFQAHMALGVLGPILVLFHTGFQTGSVNSNVALVAMLLVAGSGLVGRYLYTHIHHGLYGMRAQLKELREETEIHRNLLADDLGWAPELQPLLLAFESAVLSPPRGVPQRIGRLLTAGVRTRLAYLSLALELRRALAATARRRGWSRRQRRQWGRAALRHISNYLTTVLKIARLEEYEKLFALWHVFHVPVVIMLALTGLIHVLVVHAY